MKMLPWIIVGILLLGGVSTSLKAQQRVSLESLLREMIDRSERARYPYPAFQCKQASSTDPATVAKDQPGWFGNGDCTHFRRTEQTARGTEYVMMESEGPGAIVRFWMTFAGEGSGQGLLRIYVDGSDQPVIEQRARGLLSGKSLIASPLAMGVSQRVDSMRWGLNLFLPIPYANGCKITYQSDMVDFNDRSGLTPGHEAVFYNINYRCYEPGTSVCSFSADQLQQSEKIITRTQEQLAQMDRGLSSLKRNDLPLNTQLQPGASKTFTIRGTQAIRHLALQLEAAHPEQALRSTILEIQFDGERTVWTPVGDFYGIGYYPLYTNTWYMSAQPSGQMDAYWVMPFREKCEITLHNLSNEPVTVKNAKASYARWKWDDRSMYFGVSWHAYSAVSTGRDKSHDVSETGGPFDINFVSLRGKGVYVGDGIALFNSEYAWWGEGDEKVYVDGETFPSHLGTGTEDYYGYAWGRPEAIVDHPFIAQPEGGGAWAPTFVQNTRMRALDGIPFTQSLTFDMELWHHFAAVIDYAPTTYWYLLPGGESLIDPDTANARRPVTLHRKQLISPRMTLSVEAENMIVQERGEGGILHYHHHGIPYKDIWSGCAQAFWLVPKIGEKLTLGFESDLSGEFELRLWCTNQRDYGTVNVLINHQPAMQNINFYAPKVKVTPVNLGRVAIRKGINTITFEMVKFAPETAAGIIGIDKLEFIP